MTESEARISQGLPVPSGLLRSGPKPSSFKVGEEALLSITGISKRTVHERFSKDQMPDHVDFAYDGAMILVPNQQKRIVPQIKGHALHFRIGKSLSYQDDTIQLEGEAEPEIHSEEWKAKRAKALGGVLFDEHKLKAMAKKTEKEPFLTKLGHIYSAISPIN